VIVKLTAFILSDKGFTATPGKLENMSSNSEGTRPGVVEGRGPPETTCSDEELQIHQKAVLKKMMADSYESGKTVEIFGLVGQRCPSDPRVYFLYRPEYGIEDGEKDDLLADFVDAVNVEAVKSISELAKVIIGLSHRADAEYSPRNRISEEESESENHSSPTFH
jgi:hypothetical protein